jgi:hypothetical protein
MEYKLTIHPCLDSANEAYTTCKFETKSELMAAKNACADLLLFLQDKLRAMDDESNMFICEKLIDGEWEELEQIK